MTREQKIVLPFLVLLFATPIVLLLVQRSRGNGFAGKLAGSSRARITYEPIQGFQPVAMNEETWEWQDWKGRNRSLKVHRKVSNR